MIAGAVFEQGESKTVSVSQRGVKQGRQLTLRWKKGCETLRRGRKMQMRPIRERLRGGLERCTRVAYAERRWLAWLLGVGGYRSEGRPAGTVLCAFL